MALLLAVSLMIGSLAWPGIGDASSQENESPVLVSSISASDATVPIYYTNQAAVLTYHHLDSLENSATISPERFREHIQGLHRLGYNFISLPQLNDFLEGGKPLPPNAVAITIDDGYASVYSQALPVLQSEKVPAAVFMIVGHIGATEGEIPKLTWDEMDEMQSLGIVFQSHTYDSHVVISDENGRRGPSLTSRGYVPEAARSENNSEYQDRILYDLQVSRSILEDRLGAEVQYLALPFGSHSLSVQDSARQAGYDYVFTVEPGMVNLVSDRFALGRFNAGQAGYQSQDIHAMILKSLKND
ncbi:MAG: polysaccharide deacetylase family protein [Syntrophomonadaceae bacterium]